MSSPAQDRLREHEQELLEAHVRLLASMWAARLMAVDVSELDEHPYSEVVLEEISALVLIRDEVEARLKRLERRAARYVTQRQIGERQGITGAAVSLRLKSG